MSKDNLEESTSQKKVINFKFDKKFIVIAIFLLISVVTISFSTRYLFDSNIDDWPVVKGFYEVEDSSLYARTPYDNWAYHESKVAYGVWEWTIRYYGAGSGSIVFIGTDVNEEYFHQPLGGYKLIFDIEQRLAINKILSYNVEQTVNSTYFKPEASISYNVKVIRDLNNTFGVYINNELRLVASDDAFNSSEIIQLQWSNRHSLGWIKVTDSEGENSWFDYFSGLPLASSNNVFTKMALYAPYITLAAILVFYIIRLLATNGSWTRLLIPFIIAVMIGIGYGQLTTYIREKLPDEIPIEYESPTYTTTPLNITTTYNSSLPGSTFNFSFPSPTPNPSSGGPFTGLNKNTVSTVLLGVSSVFIVVAIVFIGIDFFRKRGDEYHEKIIEEEKRWIPKATEDDHRKRVLRAYHETSYDLIDSGAKSEKSMTPGEFEDSATDHFKLKDESLDKLTDLYEEARFSEHDISKDDSEKAEKYQRFITLKLKEKKPSIKETKEKPDSSESKNDSKGDETDE
ncbi:MAG: DUF4129 domain-containing protein [Asgard group archaeon]|nr:DUF4129 domain-containing protein [Asgard group archaeon]